MSEPTSHLEAALVYAQLGYTVFPLHKVARDADGALQCSCGKPDCKAGKHPRIEGWPRKATADPATIRQWWDRWDGANVAILAPDNVLVLDLDRKHGKDGLAELARHAPDPLDVATWPGPWASTPGGEGGAHLFLRWPADVPRPPTRSDALPGVDLCGFAKAYVIAPPSRTRFGLYQWARPLVPPDQLPLCPGWLVALLRPAVRPERQGPLALGTDARPYLKAALDGEADKLRNAPDGTGNQTLNAAAFSLGQLAHHGLTRHEAQAVLRQAAARYVEARGERAFNATFRSGWKAGKMTPRTGPPTHNPEPSSAVGQPDDPCFVPMADLYSADRLADTRNTALLSLATLPQWRNGSLSNAAGDSPHGHGWGTYLDQEIGGGVHSGFVFAVGAARAKMGKTGFVMQLATGLALRAAEVLDGLTDGPLTPVWLLTEMSETALTWRMLGRYLGYDSRIFRAGGSAATLPAVQGMARNGDTALVLDTVFQEAQRELDGGRLGKARQLIYFGRGIERGALGIDALAVNVAREKERLEQHRGRAVLPVVVIDPIQRWQAHQGSEVDALNALCETVLDRTEQGGWLTLLTSDTTKPGSGPGTKPTPQGLASAVFRGSYKLQHIVDAAIMLDIEASEASESPGVSTVRAVFAVNRYGGELATPRFLWHRSTMRFVALPESARQTPEADPRPPGVTGKVVRA